MPPDFFHRLRKISEEVVVIVIIKLRLRGWLWWASSWLQFIKPERIIVVTKIARILRDWLIPSAWITEIQGRRICWRCSSRRWRRRVVAGIVNLCIGIEGSKQVVVSTGTNPRRGLAR